MAFAPGAKIKIGGKDAEVISHESGVVHVLLDGETVSVSPEQIDYEMLSGGATKDAPAADPADGNSKPITDLLVKLIAAIGDLQKRFDALEARIPAEGGVVNPPAPADPTPPADPPETPVEQGTHSTTDSTTAADAGASAAGN